MVSSEFLAHSTDLPFQRKGIAMSLCFSGLHTPCRAAPIVIEVAANHLFIQLALVIPWHALAEMVLPDLKRTTPKGKWWLGRQLKLRIQGESSDVTSVLCCSSGSMISPTGKEARRTLPTALPPKIQRLRISRQRLCRHVVSCGPYLSSVSKRALRRHDSR